MKLPVVLLGLSLAVMVVMIFQTVRQEWNLRDLKIRTLENSAEIHRKEEAVITTKNKIRELKTTLKNVKDMTDELKKKKASMEASTQKLVKSLETCNKQKVNAEKSKTDKVAAIAQLKAGHEAEKLKAEGEIQSLKQQILDRDKAICIFVDTTSVEARKLCGISGVPQ